MRSELAVDIPTMADASNEHAGGLPIEDDAVVANAIPKAGVGRTTHDAERREGV